MEALRPTDLWPLPVYDQVRDEFRKQVIGAKKDRRVGVGPFVTLVFENRLTVKFQVQEILRVEKIADASHVQEELDGFNTMLPGQGELSATLMVELTGPDEQIAATLRGLQGLGQHVWLELGGQRVRGVFEGGRDDGKRIAAIQYVRFGLDGSAALLENASVPAALVIDHPAYQHRAALPEATRRSLAKDLRE